MNNQKEGQNQIKNILRNMRKNQNKTIEQIAEELDVSRQTVSNWESGKSTPDAASFMKLIESYDPSLENIRQLLNGKKDTTEQGEDVRWARDYCDLYKKTGSTFIKKIGPTYFFIDNFLEFTHKRVQEYNESSETQNDKKGININLFLILLSAIPPHERPEAIDYGLHMIELGLLLQHEGYIVNGIEDNGFISLVLLDDEQRKRLDSIVLEHVLIPGSTLEKLSVAERIALKGIQSEYDQIKQKLNNLKEKKLEQFRIENNFGWRMEYTLSIGHHNKDGTIATDIDAVIYTADTLEEIAKFISSVDEKVKKLVDNKDTFFVLADNHESTCSFFPSKPPAEVNGIKLYRVDCYDDDEQNEESNHE